MINLPPGNVVRKGIDLATIDFRALLRELREKMFNGYLSLSIQGGTGIEDGSLVFDSGKIVAAFYEYLKYGKDVVGDAAFVRILNASLASTGLLDIYQLSNDQVQLILAFNEAAICLPSENDVRKLQTTSFLERFEKEAVGNQMVLDKEDLLWRYKLNDIQPQAEPAPSSSSLSPSSEPGEDLLKGLPKKPKKG